MKPLGNFKGQPGGFTLLEVIIALIVGSILGAILLEFLGQTVHKSFEPIKMAQGNMELTTIVEKMNADYKKQMHAMLNSEGSSFDPLEAFRTNVINGNIDTNTPYFGNYTANASWIVFNSGGEPNQFTEAADSSGENRVLKVTVAHGQQEMTTLYTK